MTKTYVVFEGGGVEFEPMVHGIFDNIWAAKECLKSSIQSFLDDNLFQAVDEAGNALIEKISKNNYIYFYIYPDAEERDVNGYINVFVISTMVSR